MDTRKQALRQREQRPPPGIPGQTASPFQRQARWTAKTATEMAETKTRRGTTGAVSPQSHLKSRVQRRFAQATRKHQLVVVIRANLKPQRKVGTGLKIDRKRAMRNKRAKHSHPYLDYANLPHPGTSLAAPAARVQVPGNHFVPAPSIICSTPHCSCRSFEPRGAAEARSSYNKGGLKYEQGPLQGSQHVAGTRTCNRPRH